MNTRFFMLAILTMLMSLLRTRTYAYDIAVENADGVTIYYNYINDGTEVEVTYKNSAYNSYSNTVAIPDEISYSGKPLIVTAIGHNAFQNCRELTAILIPASVTTIDDYAFQRCSSLTSIIIPEKVTSIGREAFAKCTNLESISFSFGLTTIGVYAFSDCTGLTSINLPESLTDILDYAFQGCKGLTSLTIPENVTAIRFGAFSNCSALYSIVLPSNLTDIATYAFATCTKLKSISFPNNLETIGTSAFENCKSLNSIDFPDGLKSIGITAFKGCTSLASITIPNSTEHIWDMAFLGCGLKKITSFIEEPFDISGRDSGHAAFGSGVFDDAYLYVPSGTSAKYREKAGWRDFHNIMEADAVTIKKVKDASVSIRSERGMLIVQGVHLGTPISIYDFSGQLIKTAQAIDTETRIDVGSIAEVIIVKVGNSTAKVAMNY